MEKRIQNVNDAISQTADDKRRAAQARASGPSPTPGECRAVYLAACQQIATSFECDGFRYAKLSQEMSRRVKDWKQSISFQSSFHNVAGARIALSVHCNVGHSKLKKWRELNNPTWISDHVGGSQLGNLDSPPRWFDYDLADTERRPRVISEVIADLRQIALPYFERFTDSDKLVEDMLREDIPQVPLKCAVDFLIYCRDRSVAAACVHGWLTRHPDFRAEIAPLIAEYRQIGLPKINHTGYAIEVATLIVQHELDVEIA